MKKTIFVVLAAFAFGAALSLAAQEVSLGDAARAQRQKKHAASPNARVYDNENLPKGGALSTTTGGLEVASSSASEARTSSSSSSGASASASASAAGSAEEKEEQKKAEDEWRQKIADAKKNISQLERELDVLQRENRLRAAAFYGDAGTRLRDSAKFEGDDKKYQADIQTKQTELAAAKQALDQMRDGIRKAGLPSSLGE